MKIFNLVALMFFLTLGLTLTLGGCATDAKAKAKVEAIQKKQKNYTDLLQSLNDGSIHKGTLAVTIKTIYGEPDDTFSAGSTNSSTDIWTYHKTLDTRDANAIKTIRLYFSNSKLIDWRY